jgi:hypothetical protein
MKKTKYEIVLAYLVDVGNIAQREAMANCDSWRLSAIVCNLRKEGIQIDTQQEAHQDGFHARYYLVGKQQAIGHLEALLARKENKAKKKVSLSSSSYSTTDSPIKPQS